jgi:hypothetical protein
MIQLVEKYCATFSWYLVPMKLVRQITMCLNETYSEVSEDKHFYNVFPVQNGLKQGDDFGQVGGEDWGAQASERVDLGTHSEGTKKKQD